MALARECGLQHVHLGDTRKSQGFLGGVNRRILRRQAFSQAC
jgi:hypothetical protein